MPSTKLVALTLTSLSTLALLATTGCSADLSESLTPAVAATAPAPAPTAEAVTSRATAPKGSEKAPSGKQADKATQVHMVVTNKTQQVLNLVSATSTGSAPHWQERPITLQPGQQEKVSNYAASDAQIELVYVGAGDGTAYTLVSETPFAGSNKASGTSTNASYDVDTSVGGGYSPTSTFDIQPGHVFNYAGAVDTYTVPFGVTSLDVTAVGGTGGESQAPSGANPFYGAGGAKLSGTVAVTPGEVLTVAVGGSGHNSSSDVSGGWGMPYQGSTFSGGNGYDGSRRSAGGGGATVVLRADGTPVLIAGGGGGWGGAPTVGGGPSAGMGGEGGAGGWFIGGSGEGDGGGGGGGADTSQGENGAGGNDSPGGAGGGGFRGGQGADGGSAAGGGAGSSSDDGLTGSTISVGTSTRTQNGTVVFEAAS